MPFEQPTVQSASVIAMHMVDIAHAVGLTRLEMRRDQQRCFASVRSKLVSAAPKALAFGVHRNHRKDGNALQVTEDVYLARVYTAALDLFRARLVSEAVDRSWPSSATRMPRSTKKHPGSGLNGWSWRSSC